MTNYNTVECDGDVEVMEKSNTQEVTWHWMQELGRINI
jgi:hypothetical protein